MEADRNELEFEDLKDSTLGKTPLATKIKTYEEVYTNYIIPQNEIIVVRLDGKNFSKFTKNLIKDVGPFSSSFAKIMVSTARYMMKEYHAFATYTVSDEITLIFVNNTEKSQHPFGGKLFKIQSLMASSASAFFVSQIPTMLSEKIGSLPIFDCRAFSVPTIYEAYLCILWRTHDGYRNYVSTVSRLYYSAKQLFKKSTREQLEMLLEKGVNFDLDYPKFDSLFVKHKIKGQITQEELDSLPPKHNARTNVNSEYYRNVIKEMDLESFKSLCISR